MSIKEIIQNNLISTYRTQFINDAYQKVLDLLLPLNLEVIVERNLSWEWYQEVPCFNVNAQLKPMEVTFWMLTDFYWLKHISWRNKDILSVKITYSLPLSELK